MPGRGYLPGLFSRKDVPSRADIFLIRAYFLYHCLFLHIQFKRMDVVGHFNNFGLQRRGVSLAQAPSGVHEFAGLGLCDRHHHYALWSVVGSRRFQPTCLGTDNGLCRGLKLLLFRSVRGPGPFLKERIFESTHWPANVLHRPIRAGLFRGAVEMNHGGPHWT